MRFDALTLALFACACGAVGFLYGIALGQVIGKKRAK